MLVRLMLALVLALVADGPATAQPVADARQTQAPAPGTPDFLFGTPRGSIGVRGSWVFARAGSDLYDFVQRHLTVDKNDFNAPAFGFDVAVAITPRIDVRFDLEVSRTSKASEYRELVDNNLLPITQRTSLTSRSLGGSARINLTPLGRRVSRYAWVPRAVTPFVGGGAGAVWYSFEQNGDFVDFVNSDVFTDSFRSSGWTPGTYLFGGADVHLFRILFLTFEGRYLWAKATLSPDFLDFDPIDLAGFRLSTGINLVF